MTNYVNQTGIALPIAVFLAYDDYDYQKGTISVTTVMKPVRQIVLGYRLGPTDQVYDVVDLMASRMGTAIHTGIESVWTDPRKLKLAMLSLGYPESVINRIVVNGTPEQIANTPDAIPVYLEIRSEMEIEGFKLSGKFDFVAEGQVEDFKSTSVYNFMNQSNAQKYALQGSLYRLINQDIITKNTLRIHYIFTDWSKASARKEARYPQARTVSQVYPLLSVQDAHSYVRNKLIQVKTLMNAPEETLPECTDEDLWRSPTVWKYYKNPEKTTRSSGNFDSYQDALSRYNDDGAVGIIKEVKGQVKACAYCKVAKLCTQKDKYIADGSLVL